VQAEDPVPLTPAEAPAALARIVSKALEKDPARRYQSASDMLDDLLRLRQACDADTRRQVLERCRSIQALAAEQRGLEAASGAAPAVPEEDDLRQILGSEHAVIAERGIDAILSLPLTRARLDEISVALEARERVRSEAVAKMRLAAGGAADAVNEMTRVAGVRPRAPGHETRVQAGQEAPMPVAAPLAAVTTATPECDPDDTLDFAAYRSAPAEPGSSLERLACSLRTLLDRVRGLFR
jgi:hypothetical protein